VTWAAISLIGFVMIIGMSGYLFYRSYHKPSYDTWTRKSNPRYPQPEMIRSEIVQMIKGMGTATFCPAFGLWLAQRGWSKAYCGTGPNGEYGFIYHIFTFLFIWIASDFWEFYYHRLGHTTKRGWEQHKPHHLFWNPTPFAVIADEYIDQFVRSFPLILFPMLIPINMDMMFFQFGLFFYGYGVYLHWGYELEWPDAHHPWLNTAFQHYCHHAISLRNKPYHTGFFFKLWDQMFGSIYTGRCFCAKCSRAAGERTREAYDAVMKPDYSVLLQLSFWKHAFSWKPQEPDTWKADTTPTTNDVKSIPVPAVVGVHKQL